MRRAILCQKFLHSSFRQMSSKIDGVAIYNKMMDSIFTRGKNFKERNARAVTLGIISVNADVAIRSYMRMKMKACDQLRFNYKHFNITIRNIDQQCNAAPNDTYSSVYLEKIVESDQSGTYDISIADVQNEHVALPNTASKLFEILHLLQKSDHIDGILLQLPIPAALNPLLPSFFAAIPQKKDVDGFNPLNVASLLFGYEGIYPCTPLAIAHIISLVTTPQQRAGMDVVVVGRSNLVGRPTFNLLSSKKFDFTTTLLHSKSTHSATYLRRADIIVSATGVGRLIGKDDVKDGCILIDVGISSMEDKNTKKGYRLVGDINPNAHSKSLYFTPVPGGVGPVTVGMVMMNLMKCSEWREKK